MPTSGGGGHGGFGGGGSFHSGGSHGSRGGSNFHLNTFWFFAPHYYYRRGFGVFVAPIISLVVIFALIGVLLLGTVNVVREKRVDYSEETAEQYALEQYEKAFRQESAYEDKILLVFFPYANHIDYDFIAMIGDDLTNTVYNEFRGSRSALERAMKNYISSTDYESTLSRNLSSVVDEMKTTIANYGDPFRTSCRDTVHVEGTSHLLNKSGLELDKDMVNQSLAEFTGATGIEMVLVVEDAATVFGYVSPMPLIVFSLFLLLVAGAIIFAVVRGVKARKKHSGEPPKGSGGYTTGAEMDGTAKKNDSSGPSDWGDNW